MSEEQSNYSPTQEKVATGFYAVLVIAWVVTIGGGIWTVFDILNPTGKLDFFLSLNLGYQIVIVAGFLAGLFFLLIFLIGFYKRGKKTLLRIIYKKRELEERFKNRLDVKLVAGGLLVCIVAIIVGILIAIFWDFSLGPEAAFFSLSFILETFTFGNLVLFFGLGLFAIVGVALFIIYFIRNGYYLILKLFGGIETSTK